ncbi:FHA domain-containing protein [Moraxella lincolnii]|uniref:FHA domain-containing protein n=1 Tax=Lwoffella lincolnii TaxID=90241 RepID=UPI0030D612F9
MSKWSLTGVSEVLAELVIPVHDDIRIGRSPDSDVVLASQNISRQHALISIQNGNLFIKDLGSSNGTSVNDKALEPQKSKHINHDDVIAFADLVFKVTDNTQETTTTQELTVSTDKTNEVIKNEEVTSEAVKDEAEPAPTTLEPEPSTQEPISIKEPDTKQSEKTITAEPTKIELAQTDTPAQSEKEPTSNPTTLSKDVSKDVVFKEMVNDPAKKGNSNPVKWSIIAIIIVAVAFWLFNMN